MSEDYNQVLDDIELDMDIETIKLDDIELEEIESEESVNLDNSLGDISLEMPVEEASHENEVSHTEAENVENSTLDTTQTLDVVENSPEPEIPYPTEEEEEDSIPVVELNSNNEALNLDSDIQLDSNIDIPDFSSETPTNSSEGSQEQDNETEEITEEETLVSKPEIEEVSSEPVVEKSSSPIFDSDDDIISIDGRELDQIIYGEETPDLQIHEEPSPDSIEKPSLDTKDVSPEEEDQSEVLVEFKEPEPESETPQEEIPVMDSEIEEAPIEFVDENDISVETSDSLSMETKNEEASIELADEDKPSIETVDSEPLQTENIDQINIIQETEEPESTSVEPIEETEELLQPSAVESSTEQIPSDELHHDNFELIVESEDSDAEPVPPLSNEPTEILREEDGSEEKTEESDFNFDLSVIPDVTEIDEDEPISLSMDELNNIDISESTEKSEDTIETPTEEIEPIDVEDTASLPLSQNENNEYFVHVEKADEIEIPLPDTGESEMAEISEPETLDVSETNKSEEIEIEIPEDELTPDEVEPEVISLEENGVVENNTKEPDLENVPDDSSPDSDENLDTETSSLEEEIPISEADFDEISQIEQEDDNSALTDADLQVIVENEPGIPNEVDSAPQLSENEEQIEISLDELDEIQSDFHQETPVSPDVYETEPESKKSSREMIEEKMEDLSPESKEELKTVLKYLDNLLEDLPEDKIKEFSESKYYDLYVKILDKLGV